MGNIADNMSQLSSNTVDTQQSSELNEEKVLHPVIKRRRKQREDNEERKARAIKEMNFLLMNSQKYSTYFLNRLNIEQTSKNNCKSTQKVSIEENTYEELKKTQAESSSKNLQINQPETIELKYFEGTLHDYQKDGLIWLKILYENTINGILADEMGLGKTIQVIALICNLIEKKIPGPFLIVAPLSTLPNWVSEFKRFAPKLPVVLFYGPREERHDQRNKIDKYYKVDTFSTRPIVITSFQYPVIEELFLSSFRWQYLIVDEGHRIKNPDCKLIRSLRGLVSANRLILTGTPLQNNLLELWSLLNFLLPQIFPNADTFEALFEIKDFEETDKILQQEQNTNIISTIHGVLGPFMLRRLKSDVLKNMVPKKDVLVYCPLTEFQRKLYKYVLQKNDNKLRGKVNEETETIEYSKTLLEGRKKRKCTFKKIHAIPDSDDEFEEYDNNNEYLNTMSKKDKRTIIYNIKMANPMKILQKIVNHPFTVHCPIKEDTREVIIDEEIVKQSGKMMVLDAMLKKLKEEEHKVLIFCTMTQVLDFVEDFMYLRGYSYCRLDGSSGSLKKRQDSIDSFNTNPDIFAFLISTRAGGLGLNLTQADTVILYDRDWNPQVDIQAQDRCHRIGQTKPVVVYSFITKGTIDETIYERANAKRRLEKVVIKKGKFTNPDQIKSALDIEELKQLLKSVDHNKIMQTNGGIIFSEEELDNLLDRSELYKEMEERKIANEEN